MGGQQKPRARGSGYLMSRLDLRPEPIPRLQRLPVYPARQRVQTSRPGDGLEAGLPGHPFIPDAGAHASSRPGHFVSRSRRNCELLADRLRVVAWFSTARATDSGLDSVFAGSGGSGLAAGRAVNLFQLYNPHHGWLWRRPVHPAARSMAVAEALVGQLYVAILIASLVGMAIPPIGMRKPPPFGRISTPPHDSHRCLVRRSPRQPLSASIGPKSKCRRFEKLVKTDVILHVQQPAAEAGIGHNSRISANQSGAVPKTRLWQEDVCHGAPGRARNRLRVGARPGAGTRERRSRRAFGQY